MEDIGSPRFGMLLASLICGSTTTVGSATSFGASLRTTTAGGVTCSIANFGKFSLGRLELVTIAAAAAAASHCFRRWQRRNIARSNQFDGLSGLGDFLHHASSKNCEANNCRNGEHVQYCRSECAVFLVVVKAPDVTNRFWLRRQH